MENQFAGHIQEKLKVYAARRTRKFALFSDRSNIPNPSNETVEKQFDSNTYINERKMGQLFSIPDLSTTEVITKWNNVVNAYRADFVTESHIRDVVKMAFNLKSRGNGPKPLLTLISGDSGFVFVGNPSDQPIFSESMRAPDVVMPGENRDQGLPTETEQSKSKAISYICCFLLRFLTKEEDHLNNALTNIKAAYGKMYGEQSQLLASWRPELTWSRKMITAFNTYPSLKNTIAFYLGEAETRLDINTPDAGLCRMLVFQHLELSGMQLYKMSIQLMSHLKLINGSDFLEWITVPESVQTVEKIYQIGTTYDLKGTGVSKHWKYAKLSDPAYFISMSVRNNKYLARLLAELVKAYGLGGKTEYSDPLKMKALAGMSDGQAKSVSMTSKAFLAMYEMREQESGEGGGPAWRAARGLDPLPDDAMEQEDEDINRPRSPNYPPPPPNVQDAPPPVAAQVPVDQRAADAEMLGDAL